MFKHLALAAILGAPCLAFAGQGMSLDEGLAAVTTVASENDAVMGPMQDGGGTTSLHEPATGRSVDEIDVRSAAPRTAHPRGTDATTTRPHKGGHGHAPWQSLLPGVMK